uniref:uncharacterized protein isoform X2 n=1 Tax=Myxine glutinosa TaxID=7769 RepID=UPI00358E7268
MGQRESQEVHSVDETVPRIRPVDGFSMSSMESGGICRHLINIGRTSSLQSDSSGFAEDPCSQDGVLSSQCMGSSAGSSDSQNTLSGSQSRVLFRAISPEPNPSQPTYLPSTSPPNENHPATFPQREDDTAVELSVVKSTRETESPLHDTADSRISTNMPIPSSNRLDVYASMTSISYIPTSVQEKIAKAFDRASQLHGNQNHAHCENGVDVTIGPKTHTLENLWQTNRNITHPFGLDANLPSTPVLQDTVDRVSSSTLEHVPSQYEVMKDEFEKNPRQRTHGPMVSDVPQYDQNMADTETNYSRLHALGAQQHKEPYTCRTQLFVELQKPKMAVSKAPSCTSHHRHCCCHCHSCGCCCNYWRVVENENHCMGRHSPPRVRIGRLVEQPSGRHDVRAFYGLNKSKVHRRPNGVAQCSMESQPGNVSPTVSNIMQNIQETIGRVNLSMGILSEAVQCEPHIKRSQRVMNLELALSDTLSATESAHMLQVELSDMQAQMEQQEESAIALLGSEEIKELALLRELVRRELHEVQMAMQEQTSILQFHVQEHKEGRGFPDPDSDGNTRSLNLQQLILGMLAKQLSLKSELLSSGPGTGSRPIGNEINGTAGFEDQDRARKRYCEPMSPLSLRRSPESTRRWRQSWNPCDLTTGSNDESFEGTHWHYVQSEPLKKVERIHHSRKFQAMRSFELAQQTSHEKGSFHSLMSNLESDEERLSTDGEFVSFSELLKILEKFKCSLVEEIHGAILEDV